MNKKISNIILYILAGVMTIACNDDDDFSTSRSDLLTPAIDTLSLDTVFSNMPTTEKGFWIYNRSGSALRISTVRLQKGNQTGFQVNIDGTFLGKGVGYQTQDIEIRKGDSVRVFVKLNAPTNYANHPKLVEDNLVLTLESGAQQSINLKAYAWDAILLNNLEISTDTTLSGAKPFVVQGRMKVDSTATLTIINGATLYFQPTAAIDVYGKIVCEGNAEKEVTLRGARLDRMFDYLPYDNVSGQWQGIHIYASSVGNSLRFTDLHGAMNGIVCDSTGTDEEKIRIENSTIHNCQGYGVKLTSCKATLLNSQLTNTLHDCLYINGGNTLVNNCTMAQYYPFDANRGAAIHFLSQSQDLDSLLCMNSLMTGYADDVLTGELSTDSTHKSLYHFDYCIIRTPKIETADSIHFTNVVYEDVEDTSCFGKKHFIMIDGDKQRYDFSLDSTSAATNKANPLTSTPIDRRGSARDSMPDIGCYERK